MPRLREPPKKPEPVLKTNGDDRELFENRVEGENEIAPEVVAKVSAPQVADATEELKKQIEALKRSEQLARQQASQAASERDEVRKRIAERDVEAGRAQDEIAQSRVEAISSAIAAAEAEVEGAKNAIRMAAQDNDINAHIEAQSQLAEAKANLVNLTNGKTVLEAEIKRVGEAKKDVKVTPSGDTLDQTSLPVTAKNWLRAHPDYLTDPRKNAKIQSLHWDVVDEGHEAFSEPYYVSLEEHLGLRKSLTRQDDAGEDDDEPSQPERNVNVSAPVSRNAPSSSRSPKSVGEIKLTKLQREAAEMAGITPLEYAKQLLRLNEEKTTGNYGGAP